MHCYCLRLLHPDTSQEDESVLDDEQTIKKSDAASDKDSHSGDTNVNADENKEVSEPPYFRLLSDLAFCKRFIFYVLGF